MIYFGQGEQQMLNHVDEVIGDRLSGDDSYEPGDQSTADKLGKIKAPCLVIDGSELSTEDAHALMARIVTAELDAWVPNASQRLLFRAAAALGVFAAPLVTDAPDCGLERSWHAIVPDWLAGLYVHRCVTCGRLYPA